MQQVAVGIRHQSYEVPPRDRTLNQWGDMWLEGFNSLVHKSRNQRCMAITHAKALYELGLVNRSWGVLLGSQISPENSFYAYELHVEFLRPIHELE